MAMKRKPDGLCISFWNANSVNHKKQQIEQYIYDNNIDLLLISETFLKPGHRFSLANYNVYRRDRDNGPGGGTAVIIKSNIDHQELPEPELDQAEANGIIVNLQSGEQLKIYSFYSPGARRLIADDLDMIMEQEGPLLVAGDFNSKHPTWNSRTTNRNGKTLRRHADDHDYEVIGPQDPTHYSAPHRPDVIDLVLMKNINYYFDLDVIHDLDSDHNPVILKLGNDTVTNEHVNVKKTNWKQFQNYLATHAAGIKQINSPEEIEEAINLIEKDITAAIDHATQYTTRQMKNPNDIPPELKELIRQKRRAKKRAQQTRSPEDHARYNQLQNQVRQDLQTCYNQKWNQVLDEMESDDKAFWKMTRKIRNKKITYPPMQTEAGMCYTDKEKAQAFARQMERQCLLNNDPNDDINWETRVDNTAKQLQNQPKDNNSIKPASDTELNDIINKLPENKAPGIDGISNKAIKKAPKKTRMALLNIINASVRLVYYPRRWKTTNIIEIPKTEQRSHFPQDYRPISLLPTMAKITEKIILRRLNDEIQQLQLLPNE